MQRKLSVLQKVAEFKESTFVCFDYLHPSQQAFSYVRTGLSGLNQY